MLLKNLPPIAEIIPANGSAPAYVYYFINCIAESLEKRGIDKKLAIRLIAKTFIGSAEMILQSGKTPQELIDQVCSPGGLTIETINVFDKRNLFSIIDEGCTACIDRGYELSK